MTLSIRIENQFENVKATRHLLQVYILYDGQAPINLK